MIDDDDWPEKPTWDNANPSSTPALAPGFPSNKAKTAVAEEEAEREKECSICFDADLSVIFSPCGHGACTDCVTRIRREVIFKVFLSPRSSNQCTIVLMQLSMNDIGLLAMRAEVWLWSMCCQT